MAAQVRLIVVEAWTLTTMLKHISAHVRRWNDCRGASVGACCGAGSGGMAVARLGARACAASAGSANG